MRERIPRHRVGLDLGLGSAVGLAGLTYTIAPIPWLRFEVGVGQGATGTQLSAMPKITLGSSHDRFVAGAGMSFASGQDAHGVTWRVPWVNVDALGYEHRFSSGLALALAGGITTPLARFHYDITELGDTVEPGAIFPQFRLGLGYWF